MVKIKYKSVENFWVWDTKSRKNPKKVKIGAMFKQADT